MYELCRNVYWLGLLIALGCAGAARKPSPAKPDPEPPKSALALAMVALSSAQLPSVEELATDYRQRWPTHPPLGEGSKADADDGILTFEVGGSVVALGLMPVPIPWADLEDPVQTSWLWPEAEHALRGHRAHVIVGVLKGSDTVDRYLLLTRVVASLIATSPAVGVYWGSAPLVHSPEFFAAQATEASRENPPTLLWIALRGAVDGDTRTLFTEGLTAFNLMEISLASTTLPAEEMMDMVLMVAAYQLIRGQVLRDGDTIGRDGDEKLRIRHVEAPALPGGKAIQLEP